MRESNRIRTNLVTLLLVDYNTTKHNSICSFGDQSSIAISIKQMDFQHFLVKVASKYYRFNLRDNVNSFKIKYKWFLAKEGSKSMESYLSTETPKQDQNYFFRRFLFFCIVFPLTMDFCESEVV